MNFAEILKILREEKHLSQEQLSRHTGISQSAIAKWEKSKTEPTSSMIITLARFFNVTAGQILGMENL